MYVLMETEHHNDTFRTLDLKFMHIGELSVKGHIQYIFCLVDTLRISLELVECVFLHMQRVATILVRKSLQVWVGFLNRLFRSIDGAKTVHIGVPVLVSPGAEIIGLGFFKVVVEGLLFLLCSGKCFINLRDHIGWCFELEPDDRNLADLLCLWLI